MAQHHFEMMFRWIDFGRNQVGLNALSEGNAPPERLGKDVMENSIAQSDNNLSNLVRCVQVGYKLLAEKVVYLLQNKYPNDQPAGYERNPGS